MLLAEVGRVGEALMLLRATAKEGLFDSVSRMVWEACGGGRIDFEPCDDVRKFPSRLYAKEMRLLGHVLNTACAGDAESVCLAIESFGSEALPGRRPSWLKVAAGVKADVLSAAARRAPKGGITLECGTYCGYSAARLAMARLSQKGNARSNPCVLTMEVDAVHAVIARNVLTFAGLAHAVEVLTGHSEDVLPWVVSRLQNGDGEMRCNTHPKNGDPTMMVDMVFLDQRGSRYEADLAVLEQANVLCEGAIVVADNVLKPGAPLFLWHILHSGNYLTEVVSVPEFAMPGVEDWMSVSVYTPDLCRDAHAEAPPEVRMLHRKAEQMRAKAHQPDHGGNGITFTEWADFAAEMRQGCVEAKVVTGTTIIVTK